MNNEQYTDAINKMSGLPPTVAEHLVSLSAQMTDEQRAEAIKNLTPMHTEMSGLQEDILHDIDESEQQLRTARKDLQKKQEEADTSAADDLLDQA